MEKFLKSTNEGAVALDPPYSEKGEKVDKS
jgi:hypothetical protein